MTKRIRAPYRSLQAYRDAEGLSQRDAAKKFGVSQSCWAKWESGIRRPRVAVLKRLARETSIALDVLMGIAS